MSDSPKTSLTRGRSRYASASHLLRGLVIVIFLTAAAIGAVLWWGDRPVREIERALDRKEFDRALRQANAYLAEFPERSLVLDQKARALAGLGRWTEAMRLFDAIGADSPTSQRAWSQALLYEQRWSDALPLLKRLARSSPDDADVLHELAACHAKLGDFDESVRAAEQMLSLRGHEQRGRLLLGLLHYRRGNNRLALQAWQPVLEANPQVAELQLPAAEFFELFGRAQLNEGRPAEARPYLERSVRLEPSATSRNALAEACEQLGDQTEAIAVWRQVVVTSPGDQSACEGLARVALEKGSIDEARVWLKPLLPRDDLASSTAYLMQRAAVLAGDKATAAEWEERVEKLRRREKKMGALEQAVRESPHSFWSRVLRAHRFASEGNAYQASRMSEELLHEEATPEARAFVQILAEALRTQKPLPSLDLIPYNQF